MGEREDKILEFFLQSSTILGIIAVFGVVWNIVVPEAKVGAILELSAIALSFQQFLKDSPDATGILNWIFKPTTLRGIILAVCVLIGRVIPDFTIDKIAVLAAALLGFLEIFRDEATGKLVFIKEE